MGSVHCSGATEIGVGTELLHQTENNSAFIVVWAVYPPERGRETSPQFLGNRDPSHRRLDPTAEGDTRGGSRSKRSGRDDRLSVGTTP